MSVIGLSQGTNINPDRTHADRSGLPWEKEAPTYAVRAIRIDCLVTDLRFGPNRSAMRSSVLPERTLGRTTANESSFSTWK